MDNSVGGRRGSENPLGKGACQSEGFLEEGVFCYREVCIGEKERVFTTKGYALGRERSVYYKGVCIGEREKHLLVEECALGRERSAYTEVCELGRKE